MRIVQMLFFGCLIASCSNHEEKIISPDGNYSETEILEDSLIELDTILETTTIIPAEYGAADSEFDDIDWLDYENSMTKDYSYVIIMSTKSYDEALKRAEDASEKLGYPIDLRELHKNDESGLSFPKDVCEGICGGGIEYPVYLPRSDWGPNKYVSVEYSNGYEGFNPGFYIVIVASGEKGDPVVQEALKESQKYYKDAYAKTCGVWMGCGC